MEIAFTREARAHLEYWKKSGNVKITERITRLLKEIQVTPFEGTGKPEALKYKWSGYWSRRITKEDRLVYKVENNIITIVQLRFHYQ